MKKALLLSAILAMGMSSYVIAADDVPPPPKHQVAHEDHQKKDGKEWKHDDKNKSFNHDKKEHRNTPPPKHDGKAPKHDAKNGKKPPLPPEDKR
jgi:opacity protein-like surface antigen